MRNLEVNSMPNDSEVTDLLHNKYVGKTIDMVAMYQVNWPIPFNTRGMSESVNHKGELVVSWENNSRLRVNFDNGDIVRLVN